jgi:RNA polymerase sigma-70 factor (ECF subfamily)
MRHVLVDHARRKRRAQRGGSAVHIPLDAAVVLSGEQIEEVIAIDPAFHRLAAFDERKSKVLEMHVTCNPH